MRPHRKRRLRPGPATGAVALAALLAGALPAVSVAQSGDASAKHASALSVGKISSLKGVGQNYFLGKHATVPLQTKTTGDVSKVEYYADETLLARDTTAPFTGKWKDVPAGQYEITAKVFNKDGKSSTTEPVDVTVLSKPTIIAAPITRQVRQGKSTSFGVHLATKPSKDVTVSVSRADGTKDLSAAQKTLTFTPENWSQDQQVQVTSTKKGGDLENATFRASADGYKSGLAKVQELKAAASDYEQAFLDQYNKIKDPASGYFRNFNGILVPYHSVETLMVEAPDQGHETTSEAFSYYLWLEAEYGKLTEDWAPLNDAWKSIETYAIPPHNDQPTNDKYNASSPATYAPESNKMSDYPAQLDKGVAVGQDPIAGELKSAYGSSDIYGMHWLLDVDNVYGYSSCANGGPSYINSYQRGASESVWETITQPSCDDFKYGGPNGYLDLFTGDASYAKQWKYTDAPDADARAVQVVYQAKLVAAKQGKSSAISDVVAKATKMGDYLRYSMYDKYFKKIGNCTSPSCSAGSGKDSSHYLISWYYAWGGALDTSNGWAWRIGDGAAHQGYQDPLTAYALSTDSDMKPKSSTGAQDWATSLTRQLEFLQWLQTPQGGIAGGATNSWDGHYGTPPSGDSTFYGMYYDPQPVWHDPPSNRWFGFQTWGMERVAEYYQLTKNATAKKILDKWVDWALANTKVGDGTFTIPSDLSWSGQPDTWNASSPGSNSGLSVTVSTTTSSDVGVAASLAKTLMYYAAGSGDTEAQTTAEGLLDAINTHQDSIGIALPETREDYKRFDDKYDSSTGEGPYVPSGWTGTMPNGDKIDSSATFESIRSFYEDDPDWPKVQSYLSGGSAPSFTYHRFWAQTEIATAFAIHVDLFG
ncbi:glycoside hydrolase family 48 protein [Streptomyces odontomachi]|uniref:glycoside hydrolase family 48 protein n=1 Tax=Streptomyces odontomachi TaxID=2944940 RepID=UPI00210F0CD7|nr:glycoside hydrolase family 48 protein [Streptomyces sp. ODS25]